MEGTKDYSIGHLRIKYLDYANVCFAQKNPVAAHGYIDNFLDTVNENSEAGKTLKTEFDMITQRKQRQLNDLERVTEKLSYLEQEDTKRNGRTEIEVNSIHDKKETCWRIAMQYGLFNE